MLSSQPSRANEKKPQTHTVWDLPLRLFHWVMVSVVIIAGITGFIAAESWLDLHVISGYGLGILLAFRLVWGVFGSHYSLFRSFPLSLGGLFGHLRSILHKKNHAAPGHNPAGAWMIVILLFTMMTLVVTGMMVLGGQENLGPVAAMTAFQTGEIATTIHLIAAWILVAAIVIHLFGVLVEARVFHHPVLAAMMIGRKSPPYTVRGAVLFAALTSSLLVAGVALSRIPSSAWRVVDTPPVYIAECGDCHDAYHPGLRTETAWRTIMNGLQDHYGEDASLDAETTRIIGDYLDKNHAGTFDTEAAHLVGRAETPSFRMTDTNYWKARHKDIDPSVFRLKSVGSKVNCNGCHKDAASGRFDDIKIHLPTGEPS